LTRERILPFILIFLKDVKFPIEVISMTFSKIVMNSHRELLMTSIVKFVLHNLPDEMQTFAVWERYAIVLKSIFNTLVSWRARFHDILVHEVLAKTVTGAKANKLAIEVVETLINDGVDFNSIHLPVCIEYFICILRQHPLAIIII
jgi:hypothetical protein